MKQKILQFGGASVLASLLLLCANARAQVNSGSDGGDGALDFSSLTNLGYSTNIVIDMHDHANGIYQYTCVNIPTNVTVTFIPNANNSPVTWLLQSNAFINGTINVSGQNVNGTVGGAGGPGGWAGGSSVGNYANPGQGPGGGGNVATIGAGGSYGSLGDSNDNGATAGPVYGNSFLLPLLGGSGGGGAIGGYAGGGGGGGGAILIAASNTLELNGQIIATGGQLYGYAGSGSGGGVRLVAALFSGTGIINASGGARVGGSAGGGAGRVRIDSLENTFGGQIVGAVSSQGFQPIIIQTNAVGIQLAIATVGGAAVSANPTGQFITPDTLIPGSATNPIPVVVSCQNLPLNTPVTVTVDPANGSSVSVIGTNTVGTLSSSTATVSLVIPRGGGIIYATATAGN
jgi:hypothetical protein